MARSSGKKSGKKGGSGQKKASVKFRAGVPAELVDHLLKQFVQTVRTGLALMLSDPSEHTSHEKLADRYLSFLSFVGTLIWLR